MSLAAAALVIALAALVTVLIVGLIAVRSRRASDERLTAGLAEIGGKMDGFARELAAAVERVRRDALRAQAVESLKQPLDPEELLARCTEAAAALPGVAGANAAVEVAGARLVATAGLVAGREVDGPYGPPGGGAVRAVAVSYHYAAAGVAPDRVHSAIAVPLLGREGATVGFLTVFGAGEEPPVSGGSFTDLEEIAEQAGPAIEAAVERRGTASAPGDPLTGLPGRRELHDTLALEAARARRQGTRLALCLLELDAASGSGLDQERRVAGTAETLRGLARPDDSVFRYGATGFAVVIRGAGRIEGEALAARLAAALAADVRSQGTVPAVSSGIAELKDDDDGVSLVARAERSLRRDHTGNAA